MNDDQPIEKSQSAPPPRKTAGFLQSKIFSLILKCLIALAVALLIFQLGMYVGFRKANYSFAWGDNYERTFGGPRSGLARNFIGNDFMNGHGTAGTIADIDGSSLIVKDADGTEKMIQITDQTSIISGRAQMKPADLRLNDAVTVIGRPNSDGTVSAEIIRVFGSPGDAPLNAPLFPPLPPINY